MPSGGFAVPDDLQLSAMAGSREKLRRDVRLNKNECRHVRHPPLPTSTITRDQPSDWLKAGGDA
jgi:hypothetical protein